MIEKFRSLIPRVLVIAVFMAVTAFGQAVQKIHGLDFSPYENGQDPNLNPEISESQILSRMQVVAPYTVWVRSFSSTDGLENTPSVARQLGLKIAANAWISSNSAQNTLEINNLVAAANAGMVDVAIVGSEAVLRGDVTVSQLIAYINQVREAIPSGVPVVTADVYGTFLANPALIAAVDQVWANFYPYWEGTSINNAVCSLENEYQQLQTAAGSKTVVISETGWPSGGNAVGAAVPSPANANLYALQFLSWAGANNIPSFYFESFDEQWKAAYEGPQGATWGLWDDTGVIKPGANAFFNGQTTTVNCNGMLPGPVGMSFVYVPPYGSSDSLEVQVAGVLPASYDIATYIEVSGAWWTKPTFAQPTVSINPDGTARIAIETGGNDPEATAVAAFLIPTGVNPPQEGPGVLPNIPGAVATVQVSRTPSSISGTITDSQGNPIGGATISDAVLGKTTSAPDGKYSFYEITTSGSATLTVSYPNYVFPTSPFSLTIPSGNQVVNFSGTATVDLSVGETLSGSEPSVGSQAVVTVVAANAGLAMASNAIVSISLPASFTLVSETTTRGTCTAAGLQITCHVGSLVSTAYATITLRIAATSAGPFAIPVSISGPDPDSNPANNSASQAGTVVSAVNVTAGALPGATVGGGYSTALAATGGVPPYMNWTVSTGSLPPGLTLNAAAGAISGMPTTNTGSPFSFGVTVADSVGNVSALTVFSIAVSLPLPVVVSGQVTVSGVGMSGVTVTVNGSESASAVTNSAGNYSVAVVAGGSYTLSGALAGYSFSGPFSLSNVTSNQTVNFTGITVAGLEFFAVTPCRIADTRAGAGFSGQFGPPSMTGGSTRTFVIPASSCGIPSTATAYSLNFTAIPPAGGPAANLTTWPTGLVTGMPNVSTLNYAGNVVANAAIVPAGTNGAINVFVNLPTDVLFDINGYFAPSSSGMEFYTATPCRIADTRTGAGFSGQFGPPSLSGGATRPFTIPASSCGIPAAASAYSLNFTVVPPAGGPAANLTTWPVGEAAMPNVSTLNYTGSVVANAAIVPAGTGGAGVNGAINVFVNDPTNMLFDVNGYFATGLPSGLRFYPVTPCRIADTRAGAGFSGQFGPPSMTAGSTRTFVIPASTCGIAAASAYSLNFTVIPPAGGTAANLTTWPGGAAMPNVSTLNYYGSVVANAAIVPAGAGGTINVFVNLPADVLFDINGYFAP